MLSDIFNMHFCTSLVDTVGGKLVDAAAGFLIRAEQLTTMTRDHNVSTLQEYGGASIFAISDFFGYCFYA